MDFIILLVLEKIINIIMKTGFLSKLHGENISKKKQIENHKNWYCEVAATSPSESCLVGQKAKEGTENYYPLGWV